MNVRKRLAASAAVAMTATGIALATATPASAAFTCHVENSIKKICNNGFSAGQWANNIQTIKVYNAFNFDAYFRVESQGGGSDLVCIPSGKSRTYDRGTVQVGTSYSAGKLGWALPAPC
ncbi:hypothetical protein [Prauserella cavernicola]|uniref:Secreted protein n=1 Tax=Prauserella cavernicola TaxID=2800127 RepID=A0A934V845_9PSEU|nr:hypothetical protein [Prauserella cavernicola]MBK1787348.1 hypothetical protein [Prauserella cavernicola]